MSNLAGVCALTGRAKEVLRIQAKVKEFREKNPYHHYNLGTQAFEEGRYQEAIAHYRRALKLKATEHNFYFALVLLCYVVSKTIPLNFVWQHGQQPIKRTSHG